MDKSNLRLFLLNIRIVLLIFIQVVSAFILLAITEIVPLDYTIALSKAIGSIINTSVSLEITAGEIMIIGLIGVVGGQILLNQSMEERERLLEEIALEKENERTSIDKDTL